MSDWLHNLPVPLMALVVFGLTYLLAAIIFILVTALAAGERARAFKAVSPGMLPPLGIIFGLFVGFTAAQVWSDNAQAEAAVQREASALQSIVVFAGALPTETQNHLRTLVHSYIAQAVAQEWPLMAKRNITLTTASPPLAECGWCSASTPRTATRQQRSAASSRHLRMPSMPAANASQSANPTSIGSSGQAYTCSQLVPCLRSPWCTATILSRRR